MSGAGFFGHKEPQATPNTALRWRVVETEVVMTARPGKCWCFRPLVSFEVVQPGDSVTHTAESTSRRGEESTWRLYYGGPFT